MFVVLVGVDVNVVIFVLVGDCLGKGAVLSFLLGCF